MSQSIHFKKKIFGITKYSYPEYIHIYLNYKQEPAFWQGGRRHRLFAYICGNSVQARPWLREHHDRSVYLTPLYGMFFPDIDISTITALRNDEYKKR